MELEHKFHQEVIENIKRLYLLGMYPFTQVTYYNEYGKLAETYSLSKNGIIETSHEHSMANGNIITWWKFTDKFLEEVV